MSDLSTLQHRFIDAVFQSEGAVGEPPERFSIYRNALQLNLRKCLQASYPVCERLVGEGFFRTLCHYYIESYPPTSPNIEDYGDQFSAFIANFSPAESVPYLVDVAHLEWAMQQAEIGPDVTPLESHVLAQQCETTGVHLPKNATLMTSKYPVVLIWQVNQPGYSGEQQVDLAVGGGHWIIWRPGQQAQIEALATAEYFFLEKTLNGSNLGEIAADCLENQIDFAAVLADVFARHWVTTDGYIPIANEL